MKHSPEWLIILECVITTTISTVAFVLIVLTLLGRL